MTQLPAAANVSPSEVCTPSPSPSLRSAVKSESQNAAQAPEAPSPFFANTNFQWAWDATSLGTLKDCPRKYELSIIRGLRRKPRPKDETAAPFETHLPFGTLFHEAVEQLEVNRAQGYEFESGLRDLVRRILVDSISLPEYKTKSRETLIRSIIEYADAKRSDPIQAWKLKDGEAAAELSFQCELGPRLDEDNKIAPTIVWCGHIDRIVSLGGTPYVLDTKTTGMSIRTEKGAANYFSQFSPDNQFLGYAWAASVVYGVPVRGVIVDAVQVAKTFTAVERAIMQATPQQVAEWKSSVPVWVRQADSFAAAGFWPMNERSCHKFGGCQFREICRRDPSVREGFIAADFEVKLWNPLVARRTGELEPEADESEDTE